MNEKKQKFERSHTKRRGPVPIPKGAAHKRKKEIKRTGVHNTIKSRGAVGWPGRGGEKNNKCCSLVIARVTRGLCLSGNKRSQSPYTGPTGGFFRQKSKGRIQDETDHEGAKPNEGYQEKTG